LPPNLSMLAACPTSKRNLVRLLSNMNVPSTPKCLVALDMDGTTLNHEKRLTQRTIETIRRVRSCGAHVVIATGRPTLALQPYIEQLAIEPSLPVICFNGACTLWMKPGGQQHDVIFSDDIGQEAAKSVLALCEQMDWCPMLNFASRTVSRPRSSSHEEQLKKFQTNEGILQERADDLWQVLNSGPPPLKIVVLSEDPDRDAKLARERLPASLVHIIAAELHMEFLNPLIHKGGALQRLCKDVLGVPLAEAAAFGDNHNDSEMLTVVGEGIAMANAKSALQAVAKRVSLYTNAEEGVARELSDMMTAGQLISASNRAG